MTKSGILDTHADIQTDTKIISLMYRDPLDLIKTNNLSIHDSLVVGFVIEELESRGENPLFLFAQKHVVQIINRPGVAGAVLQSPSSLIH